MHTTSVLGAIIVTDDLLQNPSTMRISNHFSATAEAQNESLDRLPSGLEPTQRLEEASFSYTMFRYCLQLTIGQVRRFGLFS